MVEEGIGTKTKRSPRTPRQEPRLLVVDDRIGQRDAEVTLSLSSDQAVIEAHRCLSCKKPVCIDACPIGIDVKAFIACVSEGDFRGAFTKISEQNPFPGICGRVCQHELFCEKACLLGSGKLKPVAIGAMERFVADQHAAEDSVDRILTQARGAKRIALVGSGPASLICAYDLIRNGYRVTVFEALHELGGVLAYGIPPFRLPRHVLHTELERLRTLGVEFHTNVIVGKTVTIDELFKQGFSAVFLGTGAGLPKLMEIPGENLIGVYTANEFLTRINLMRAYEFPISDTPVMVGEHAVIVGGGNAAMDSARWARRFGSETTILYRRGRAELPARIEEVSRAEEEGVTFTFLAAPMRLIGNGKSRVSEMECIHMALGEPDESGRRSPIPIPGSEFRMPAEIVVCAIGQDPNPTIQRATPEIITAKGGRIVVDARSQTSIPLVYAGGDVVRGGATVILALHDGRLAAEAIHAALKGEGVKRE